MDQQTELILYLRFNRKPMKSHGGRRHVISRSKTVDKAYRGVDDPLQLCATKKLDYDGSIRCFWKSLTIMCAFIHIQPQRDMTDR